MADLNNMLASGIDALFGDNTELSIIPLDMIEVKAQIREDFEDEENTLEDLAASIKDCGVIQPIVLRPTDNGYELVAGERRFRASKLAGLDTIPAIIKTLTDEDAEELQLAENIHRKNLTQIEEAKKIQRDLDRLGNVEAVLALYHKSNAWLSKRVSLLTLPEQAKRLVTENISSDIEVINTVKVIEKKDPEKARNLVNDLKETKGVNNARNKVNEVKETVKPKKNKTGTQVESDAWGKLGNTKKQDEEDKVQTPEFFAGAKNDKGEQIFVTESDIANPEKVVCFRQLAEWINAIPYRKGGDYLEVLASIGIQIFLSEVDSLSNENKDSIIIEFVEYYKVNHALV